MPLDYLTAESHEVRNARASLDRIERALRKAEAHHVPAIGNERYLNPYVYNPIKPRR